MRRDKLIERLKVSLALVAAVTLFLVLLPLYAFPSWVIKYGWNDIPVRGKFVFGDMGICTVEPFTLSGGKLPKGFRPFGYVTVIPDTFPERKLLGRYNGCAGYSSSRGCAYIEPCYYPDYPIQTAVTIIFHPNPYIQAQKILLDIRVHFKTAP